MELTQEQITVKNEAETLLGEEDYVTIGGYAGTGKTTLIKEFVTPNTITMAYTGKAASVLKRKGVNAATIHSTIYKLILDEEGKPILDGNDNLQWELNPDLVADKLIIDEASMVPEWIHNDIMSFNIPTLYVGDHGQLPPVGDDFNLMEDPILRLEKIHRNAGDIARFAHALRQGYDAEDYPECESVRIGRFDPLAVDQIICGFNKTRQFYNLTCRTKLQRRGFLEPDEKVIVLQNKREYGIFNGLQGKVVRYDPKTYRLTVHTELDTKVTFPVFAKDLEKKTSYTVPIAYSYAITCHKAQGDEYDTIGVVEEQCDYWEPERWNYTAASRARNLIYWKV